MGWIKQYSTNIAVILIFSGFLGLALPGGKYKDYIKLVTGLMVILVIISPVVKIMNSGGFEELLIQAERELNVSIAGKERFYYNDIMLETLFEVYSGDIVKQLGEKMQTYGYRLEDADIYIDESYENFGRITGMELTLSKWEGEKETKKDLIKVDKIRIEPIVKEQAVGYSQDSSEITELKNFISGFYNLSSDNIYIKLR